MIHIHRYRKLVEGEQGYTLYEKVCKKCRALAKPRKSRSNN